jgi:hypothetical protein
MAHSHVGFTTTTYDSATLTVLGRAFDEVWNAIAGNYGSPQAVEAARSQLAMFILNHAPSDGVLDVELIKYSALVAMGHKESAAGSAKQARADVAKESGHLGA